MSLGVVCAAFPSERGGGGGGRIQRKLAIVLFPPLELFKEHAAPWLHVNAIIILVFLFFPADATLTFSAFPSLFFSGESELAA